MPQISATLIVKNEQANIENCIKSIRPHVDELVIVDTGSTDKTPEICKIYADKFEVYTDCNDKDGRIKDFSQARNRALELASHDWIFWCDGDDEVVGAQHLRKLAMDHDHLDNVMFMFNYNYSFDHKGDCTCSYKRERLVHRKRNFSWVNPVHEVLQPKNVVHYIDNINDIYINHRREHKVTENRRNLNILKAQTKLEGRNLFYYGMECINHHLYDDAIPAMEEYIKTSTFYDEKYYALLRLSEIYINRFDLDKLEEVAHRAIAVKPSWQEAYFLLGRSFYERGMKSNNPTDFDMSVRYYEFGLSLPPTKTNLFVNPQEREFNVHLYLNLSYAKTNKAKEALESAKKYLSKYPDNKMVAYNKDVLLKYIATTNIKKELISLKEEGVLSNESIANIEHIISNNCQEHKNDNIISASKTFASLTSSKSKNIVIYVGNTFEEWDPESVKVTGIGGSELAVIHMSKNFVDLGNKVTVYGKPKVEGNYDGVEYKHFSKYCNLECDVLITSRAPQAIDDHYNVKSKVAYLWVHDVNCWNNLTEERASKFNAIFCLTNWHKNYFLSYYKFLREEQVLVTRNGIITSRFDSNVYKDKYKVIYSSSPDRGLDVALNVWKKVVEREPNANLHVYYGFDCLKKAMTYMSDENRARNQEFIDNLMGKIHSTKNVIFHGRMSQDVLAKEFLSANVWLYPTTFTETSCISAMEAQAAGLKIISSPVAALTETVGNRGVLIDTSDYGSENYLNRVSDEVIKAINSSDEDAVKNLKVYGKTLDWSNVAKEWNSFFNFYV